MSGGDWHDSLFKDEKGDALGDGTWGKPDPTDGKLAPVAWDKLPEAPDPNKRVRARLATPAPGSQKESGLLDIKLLAPSLAQGMRNKEPEHSPSGRQPTPPPVESRPARLATAAKGSAGSGLIDVQEMVRLQERSDEAKDRAFDREKANESVAEAAIEAMNSSASMNRNSLSSSGAQPRPAVPTDALDELDEVAEPGRSSLVTVVIVLALAFAALAVYVLMVK